MSGLERAEPLDFNDEAFDLIFENFLEINKHTNEYAKILGSYPKYAETYQTIYANLTKQVKREIDTLRNASTTEKRGEESDGKLLSSSSTSLNKALLSLKKELLKSSL